MDLASATAAVEARGFFLYRSGFATPEVADLLNSVEEVLRNSACAPLSRNGRVYGARNLLAGAPGLLAVVRDSPIANVAKGVLGEGAGVVRCTYFDKQPGASWFVPWHRDEAIAVEADSVKKAGLRATLKGGVPHVDAPWPVLEGMLAARIHLDDASETSGALEVVPGSHRAPREGTSASDGVLIEARAGDVLFMRPLLFHRSRRPTGSGVPHRRVIHLELAASPGSCAPLTWHRFDRL